MQTIFQTSLTPSFNLANDDWPELSSITQEPVRRPRLEDISFESVLDRSLDSTQSVSLEQPKKEFVSNYEWDFIKPIVTLDFIKLYKK